MKLKSYRGMGSLEAMTKGSDARYLGDKTRLKIAQGVSGSVAAKGSVLRLIPYTLQAVKQGLQDLGVPTVKAAHDGLNGGYIRLEVSWLFSSLQVSRWWQLLAFIRFHVFVELNRNGMWTQVRSGAAQREGGIHDLVSYEKRRF